MMDMSYYDSYAKSFQFDTMYEGLTFNDVNKIEEIKQLAAEAYDNKILYREKKQAKKITHSSKEIQMPVEQTSEFQQQDVLQSGVEATKLVTRQSELTEQSRNITQIEKEKRQMKEGTVIQ